MKITDIKNLFIPKKNLQMKTQLEAQAEVIKALNERVDNQMEVLNNYDWNDYQWLLIYANKIANRYKFKTNRTSLDILILNAVKQAFMWGVIYVYVHNGTPQLCYASDYDKAGEYVEITTAITWDKEIDLKASKMLKVRKDEVIKYQFDTVGLPALFMFKKVIEWEKRQWKSFFNEQTILPSRVLYSGNKNGTREQVNKFIKNVSPVLMKGDRHTETYESLTLASNVLAMIEQDDYQRNLFYSFLGIRSNTDFKKERNLTSEIELNEVQFDTIENERYLYLRTFLEKLSFLTQSEIVLENREGEFEKC